MLCGYYRRTKSHLKNFTSEIQLSGDCVWTDLVKLCVDSEPEEFVCLSASPTHHHFCFVVRYKAKFFEIMIVAT